MLQGRCLCGAVRFRAGEPLCPPTYCHCASCRRSSGAVALPWVTVDDASLVIEGEALRWYASSPLVQRGFCARCGTPLAYRHDDRPGETDLTVGALDAPQDHAPADHIWMQDALPWDQPGDALPCFARRRADGGASGT